MKTKDFLKWTMACAVGALVTISCDNDDDDRTGWVNSSVQAAFDQMYGNTGRVEWDREDGGYYVAEFRKDNRDHDAWFKPDGTWVMTEIDHGRSMQGLPQEVQDGYAATTYAMQQWRIDDIDEIRRPQYETVFIFNVEKAGEPDYDLYFDLGGTLFREVQDGDGNRHDGMLPTGLPAEIQSFIDTKYSGAVVVDIDNDYYGYDVDIRHEGKSIEIRFDNSLNWVLSSTDMTRNIPADIRSAVESRYPGKRIEDCDYIETATGEQYYMIDLDNYNMNLRVGLDGTITEVADR